VSTGIKYGFNRMFSNFFEGLQREVYEIVDLHSPDTVAYDERSLLRAAADEKAFDPEHYM
jgi:hypothetical protein